MFWCFLIQSNGLLFWNRTSIFYKRGQFPWLLKLLKFQISLPSLENLAQQKKRCNKPVWFPSCRSVKSLAARSINIRALMSAKIALAKSGYFWISAHLNCHSAVHHRHTNVCTLAFETWRGSLSYKPISPNSSSSGTVLLGKRKNLRK